MKKLLFGLVLFVLPTSVFAATFDSNLSYGSSGNDVTALQEFLTVQHVYTGPITGNFYSLTLAAVKKFQSAESISPISGFVGPITRATINSLLSQQTSNSEENAATSTDPVDLSTPIPVVPTQTNQWHTPPIVSNVTPPTVVISPIQPILVISQRNPPSATTTNILTTDANILAPGTNNATLASIGIEVSPGDENVMISSVPMTLTVGNGGKASDLSQCQLWAYGGALNTGDHSINGSATTNGSPLFHGQSPYNVSYNFDNSLIINQGLVFIMTIQCNISSQATSGSIYAWTIDQNASDWKITGAQYGDSITVAPVNGFGDLMQIQ